MTEPLRITSSAQNDLEKIARDLARRASVETAERMLMRLYLEIDELVRLPSIGHLRGDLPSRRILSQNVHPYVILFRREPKVIILRVLHGARDFTKLF